MNARIALVTGLLAAACVAAAANEPAAAAITAPVQVADDGVVRYPYPGAQPKLACAPLTVCTIGLQNGESVTGLATGDSARWIIATTPSGPGGSTPLVLVKPKAADLRTNLVIATTSHVYYIDLISSTGWTNPRIAFYYPAEAQAAADAQAQRAADSAKSALPLVPSERLDTAYRISGPADIAPARVANDGVHTYVEYDTLPTDLPAIFAIAPGGANQVVNYRLQERTFIVDGLPSGIDLILNAGTGKHGSGERRVQIRRIASKDDHAAR